MDATAKVFKSGNSQAVRLPKQFRIDATEVTIRRGKHEGELILRPKPSRDALEAFFEALDRTPKDDREFLIPEAPPEPRPFDDWAPAPKRRPPRGRGLR